MFNRLMLVVAACSWLSLISTAQSGFFLTGAQIFETETSGSLKIATPGAPPRFSDFRYSTNANDTGSAGLRVSKDAINHSTLDRSISLSLLMGDNTFNYEVSGGFTTSNAIGINLFFAESTTPVSYNPVTNAGIQAPGHLSVFLPNINSSDFQFISSSSNVMNYAFVLNGVEPKALGNAIFGTTNYLVTVTSFMASTDSAYRPTGGAFGGSFTLTVTATPEPSTIGIGALACCGLAHWVRKRRNNKRSKAVVS